MTSSSAHAPGFSGECHLHVSYELNTTFGLPATTGLQPFLSLPPIIASGPKVCYLECTKFGK